MIAESMAVITLERPVHDILFVITELNSSSVHELFLNHTNLFLSLTKGAACKNKAARSLVLSIFY